jgi:hypothetical protein
VIFTVTSRLTHRSLMNKSKSELASMVLDRCDAEDRSTRSAESLAEALKECVRILSDMGHADIVCVIDARAALKKAGY